MRVALLALLSGCSFVLVERPHGEEPCTRTPAPAIADGVLAIGPIALTAFGLRELQRDHRLTPQSDVQANVDDARAITVVSALLAMAFVTSAAYGFYNTGVCRKLSP